MSGHEENLGAERRAEAGPPAGEAYERSTFLAGVPEAVRDQLSTTVSLSDSLRSIPLLSMEEQGLVVQRALDILEGYYVHLPLKRAMHAIDPIQRLRLLSSRIEQGDATAPRGLAFHAEMTRIFTSTRDLHTNYLLPSPYRQMTAYLPFLIEEYFEEGERRYIVSRVLSGFDLPSSFEEGVEILYWNGVAIDRAVAMNSDRQAGSNEAARHAQGLDSLTVRPLIRSLPPDEEWVTLRYRALDAEEAELRHCWVVFTPGTSPAAVNPDVLSGNAVALGVDVQTDAIRHARKVLYAPSAVASELQVASGAVERSLAPRAEIPTSLPTVFRAKAVDTEHGRFAYVRIFTFSVSDADSFVKEFVRLVEDLPQDGLIVDVRGNGGGLIYAGEQLLQTLTPRRIEPSRFQFINTRKTLRLCRTYTASNPHLDLSPWKRSLEDAVRTGAIYSRAFPISKPEACNNIGQRYCGPVVLITDALCYSATDIFAAGFQDHNIGPILGCDGNTGAGGANVWTYALLCALMGDENESLQPLPADTGMRVSVRRTLRVGNRSGTPLEDLGVVPQERHHMTRRDVLEGNTDLIEHAGRILSLLPTVALGMQIGDRQADSTPMIVTTKNIAQLDVYVDGHPRTSVSIQDGETPISISTPDSGSCQIEVQGFDANGRLVAGRREHT